MAICWYCHWGWAKPVVEIYKKAVKALGGGDIPMHYGPAHIVWADENFETNSLKICLANLEQNKGDLTEAELAIVRQSLEEMLALP